MKVGVIGAGAVGSALLLSLVTRGLACEIVVIDRNRRRAEGVVTDLQYGATLSPAVVLDAGDYPDLSDAVLVIIRPLPALVTRLATGARTGAKM